MRTQTVTSQEEADEAIRNLSDAVIAGVKVRRRPAD